MMIGLKKITHILLSAILLIVVFHHAYAAEPVLALPAPAPAVKQNEANAAEFENWLKDNEQPAVKPAAPPAPPPLPAKPPEKLIPKKKKIYMSGDNSPEAPTVQSLPMSYEESQKIMLKQAPPAPAPSPESDAAFDSMLQENMPMSPQQVVRLRQQIDTSQRAAVVPPTVPPKPVSTTLMINQAPGATPPAIRLAQGYVTSLVFVDSTGAPWPIASYDVGDPKSTNIQWDGKSNILLMQSAMPYSSGNMVVRLVGLPTPITLEIVSGQRVVDYRTDIHVPGIGPNSKEMPIGTPLPDSANQILLGILDGVAPAGSRQLMVKGGDCQAWLLGDKMYLRTRLTVLSPGWIGRMVSPDGMNSYEIQKSASVLVSQYGNPIELKIEGF